MRRPLTSRERKIAALTVLALLLWASWYLLIDSWFAGPLREMAEQADDLNAQQYRYAQRLIQAPAVRAQLEHARQDPTSRSSLLPGDDPSAVAADLMQFAVDQVKAQADTGPGCEVTQRMPIVPEVDAAQPYREVKVSLSLDCAIEPLIRLFAALEYHRPFLFIDSLSVHRTTNAPAKGGPGRLQVQLLVRGYMAPAAEGGPRS